MPEGAASNSKAPRLASLSVVVPVFNEEHLVSASLNRLHVLAESPLLERVQIIVVDDCSNDRTAAVLAAFQESLARKSYPGRMEWKFLRHEHNRGKGGAIQTGLSHADCELTVIHDADLEYHPRDLLRMIPIFTEQNADAVYGSRFLSSEFRRVLFFRHSLGNRFLTFLCDLACDLNLSDMETCYKMVRTPLLRSIPIESRDFRVEPELTVKLAKRNARIFEVPISYSGRTYREGKKITWKDGFLALSAIIRFSISDNICLADQYGSEILARLRRAPRFTSWMADTIRPFIGEKVLEIGAGIGNLTLNLTPRSLYWASDINPHYLHELQKLQETRPYLHSSSIDLTLGDSFPTDQKFDTVICLNVLEHVEKDREALRNIWETLEEGGRALVLVPQGPRLYGSLDRILGHFRRYKREQLRAVAESAGFHIQTILAFNRVGVLAWWINGKLLKRQSFGLLQIKILNSLVPIFRRLERWMPLPPLSLIAILEKNTARSSADETRAVVPDLAGSAANWTPT